MKLFRLLSIILLILLLPACNNNASVENTLNDFIGREVSLPLQTMRSMKNGKDTTLAKPISGSYKEIAFVDSSVCTSCMYRHLYKWIPIIEEAKEKGHDVEFIFILHPAKSSRIGLYHEMMQPQIFSETVFVDTAGIFARSNPSIPDANIYHYFLLDEDNRVVMVGDPTRNQKLHDLFFSKLKP